MDKSTTHELFETLKKQTEIRDGTIESLKRENNILSAVIREIKRKHMKLIKFIIILSGLLILSVGINIYQLLK